MASQMVDAESATPESRGRESRASQSGSDDLGRDVSGEQEQPAPEPAQSEQPASQRAIPKSSSVSRAVESFAADEPVSAWDLVVAVLRNHSEYGGGHASSVAASSGPTLTQRRPARAWVEQVWDQFDYSKVPLLHGRLFILGICECDPDLAKHLKSSDFYYALRHELREDLETLFHRLTVSNFKWEKTKKQKDQLDIRRDVETLASVLTFKDINPPLAVGLFGDWGSGKSFFMEHLRSKIRFLSESQRNDEGQRKNHDEAGAKAAWCQGVVQIEFNAWHYADANLWASMVSHIFEELDVALSDPSGRLVDTRTDNPQDTLKKAELELRSRQIELDGAVQKEAGLNRAMQEAESAALSSRKLISNIVLDALRSDRRLVDLAKASSNPEAEESIEALRHFGNEIQSVRGRASVLVRALADRRTLVLVLLVLFLPLAVLIVGGWLEAILGAAQRAGGLARVTLLAAGLTTVTDLTRRGNRHVKTIRGALEKIQDASEVIQQAKQNIASDTSSRIRADLDQARATVDTKRRELAEAQQKLTSAQPARRFAQLIADRTRTREYSRHLGIVNRIRTDFEELQSLLGAMHLAPGGSESQPEGQGSGGAPPMVDRIILYIDDLDRCRPQRVVEVLEAVHMLLAFDLFVVVVAVDPRWLRRSLSQRYPITLAEATVHRTGNGTALDVPVSTPQDYLEKIFQIPLALRPVNEVGFRNLVLDSFVSEGSEEKQRDPVPKPEPDGQEDVVPRPDVASLAAGGAGGHHNHDHEGKEPPSRAIRARQLTFQLWEQKHMELLWPLFRTPRTVKRFVNCYRLVRAGLESDEAIAEFEGAEPDPGEFPTGEFPIVQWLLAVVSAFPTEAPRYLGCLFEWLAKRNDEPSDPLHPWSGFFDALERAGRPAREGDRVFDAGEDVDDGIIEAGWTQLARGTRQVLEDSRTRLCTPQLCEPDKIHFWAKTVVRYSFTLFPDYLLDGAQVASGRRESGSSELSDSSASAIT